MIVVREVDVSDVESIKGDFRKSLSSNAADKKNYVLISSSAPIPMNAKIVISLPNDCLVIHNSWDRYILYNLDNKKLIDLEFVKKRLGLIDRRHSGIYPEVKVLYPSLLTKIISRLKIW